MQPPLTLLGALLSIVVLLFLPLTVGTLDFFIAYAFFFGLYGFFLISWQKRRWAATTSSMKSVGDDRTPTTNTDHPSTPTVSDRDDDLKKVVFKDTTTLHNKSSVLSQVSGYLSIEEYYPYYVYEGSFYTLLLVNALFTAGMLYKLAHVGIRSAAEHTWVDIYEQEHFHLSASSATNTIISSSYNDNNNNIINNINNNNHTLPAAAFLGSSMNYTTWAGPFRSDGNATYAAIGESSTLPLAWGGDVSGMATKTPFFALEHCIFASHFGFMIKDIFVLSPQPTAQGRTWEPIMPTHHLGACVLLLAGYFSFELPGIRLLALSTSVMELGSASCCAWFVWRLKTLYVIAMNLSNAVFFACICAIYWYAHARIPWWFHHSVVGAALFITGRTALLILDLRKHDVSECVKSHFKQNGRTESQCVCVQHDGAHYDDVQTPKKHKKEKFGKLSIFDDPFFIKKNEKESPIALKRKRMIARGEVLTQSLKNGDPVITCHRWR